MNIISHYISCWTMWVEPWQMKSFLTAFLLLSWSFLSLSQAFQLHRNEDGYNRILDLNPSFFGLQDDQKRLYSAILDEAIEKGFTFLFSGTQTLFFAHTTRPIMHASVLPGGANEQLFFEWLDEQRLIYDAAEAYDNMFTFEEDGWLTQEEYSSIGDSEEEQAQRNEEEEEEDLTTLEELNEDDLLVPSFVIEVDEFMHPFHRRYTD